MTLHILDVTGILCNLSLLLGQKVGAEITPLSRLSEKIPASKFTLYDTEDNTS